MKIKEAFKKAWKFLASNPFRVIISIIFLIGCSMIGFYIFQFSHIGLSESTSDWANFGAYFGSITGLLAFAGVLYSASLSEERAKKLEDESKTREERDQFFKLLELFQNKVENFEIEGYKGMAAFKKIGEDANKCLVSYIALKDTVDRNFSTEGLLEGETLEFLPYRQAIWYYSKSSDQLAFYKKVIKELNFDVLLDINTQSERYFNYLLSNKIITTETQYQHLKYIGTLLLKKYGFVLDSYINNLYYLLSSLNTFQSNNNFNNLLTAQISRYESLIILFCAISNKSDYRNISNLQGTLIFRNINPEDYLLYNGSRTTTPDLDGIIHFVLSKCLEDIREYYIEGFDITVPHK